VIEITGGRDDEIPVEISCSGHIVDTICSMITGIFVLASWFALVLYWNVSARSIKSAAEDQSFSARLARMPVWLGFVLFIVAWAHPFGPAMIRRTPLSDSVGVAFCAFGLWVAIWSRKVLGAEWSRDVELKQGHRLVQNGPYRLMRHPIYSGHLLMGLGTAIASGSLIAFAGLASFALGFWIKLKQEDRLLLRGFPDEYPPYKAHVRALIPFVL
jgi:protein-S-isoprenylcysteine O-methyltransferase Ste14